jgi:beta-galactosidase
MKRLNLCSDWRFHYQANPAARLISPDIEAWRSLDIPHDWSIELERDPKNISGYSGGYFPMGCG